MNTPVRILGIAGSLRRRSYNRAALRAGTKLLHEAATLDVFELDGIPGFNQDDGSVHWRNWHGACPVPSPPDDGFPEHVSD